jgi:hypothetical protein
MTDERYQHASGDDESGCVACQVDAIFEGVAEADVLGCQDAVADADEPALCAHCSHTLERIA